MASGVGRMRVGLAAAAAVVWMLGSIAAVCSAQQPPATATIAGKVTDKVTGEPVIDAGVEILGQNITVRTDVDGRYSVKVPPGRYQVRIFAPLYQGVRLEGVQVAADKVANASAAIAPTQAGMDVVEVVAQADKAAEATQLQQRRQAAVVSETVSAEVIKKSPDSDAAEVVQRVPAVT